MKDKKGKNTMEVIKELKKIIKKLQEIESKTIQEITILEELERIIKL